MTKKTKHPKILDQIGMILSGLCALHCSFLPIVFLVGMGTGFGWMTNDAFELTFFIFSLVIATLSLFYGYVRYHRKLVVVLLALAGFVMFVLGHQFLPLAPKILLTSLGGVCIVYAHYLNLKFKTLSYTLAIKR